LREEHLCKHANWLHAVSVQGRAHSILLQAVASGAADAGARAVETICELAPPPPWRKPKPEVRFCLLLKWDLPTRWAIYCIDIILC
jgi:hypothetical protein